jgi:hypothetical protein
MLAARFPELRVRELGVVDVGHRQHLRHVDAGELLQRQPVGGLMNAAPDEKVADHRPCRLVRGHFVAPGLVRPRAALQEEIVQEIEHQVSGVEHVVAPPRRTMGIGDRMPGATLDEMVVIADVLHCFEGRIRGIGIRGSLIEQGVDRGRDELHVPDLFGRDRGDEFIEGPELLLGLHRDRLVEIVVECRHLAETAAEKLLDGRGGVGVELGRGRQVDLQFVDAQEHGTSSGLDGRCPRERGESLRGAPGAG